MATRRASWKVSKATGNLTFVEKISATQGLLNRFTFYGDEGDAERLAALLNKLETQLWKLSILKTKD